jgi:hypothetical protein
MKRALAGLDARELLDQARRVDSSVHDNSKLILIEETVLTMRNRYTGDRSRKVTQGMSGHVRAKDAMVKYKCSLVRL